MQSDTLFSFAALDQLILLYAGNVFTFKQNGKRVLFVGKETNHQKLVHMRRISFESFGLKRTKLTVIGSHIHTRSPHVQMLS